MNIKTLGSGLLCLATLGCSNGAEFTQPIGIGVGLSSVGAVIEPTYRISSKTGVRMPLAFGSANTDQTIDGINYDVSGRIGGVGLLADYFPAGSALRFSGGLFKSNMSVDGRATGNVDVGANTYVGVDLTSNVEASNSIAPMVSVGYDGQVGNGWGVSADVGAIFVGGFEGTVTDATGTVSAADLNAEMDAINDELGDISAVPYLKLGATYRW